MGYTLDKTEEYEDWYDSQPIKNRNRCAFWDTQVPQK